MTRFRLPRLAIQSYIYLVWLIFLVTQPIFDPNANWVDWALIPLMLALFLPIYFWGCTGSRRRRLLSIAGMSLLGLIFVPFNSGAGSFFIYASAAAAFALPPRRAFGIILAVLLLVPISGWLTAIPWPYTLLYIAPVSLMVLLVGSVNIFEAQKDRANSQLRRANEEIENLAKIAERERIARDLHDLLGHTLSTITLKAELASRLVERDPARAASEMRQVEGISRQALSEVRDAVRGYRSRGIHAELEGIGTALEAAGIRFERRLEELELSPVQEGVIVLALREAVTNVIRHSSAGSCSVTLTATGTDVLLTVEDDGVGSSGLEGSGLEGSGTDGSGHEGSGLQGMRERAESLGGSVQWGAGPDEGTRLVVRLPRSQRVPGSASMSSRERVT